MLLRGPSADGSRSNHAMELLDLGVPAPDDAATEGRMGVGTWAAAWSARRVRSRACRPGWATRWHDRLSGTELPAWRHPRRRWSQLLRLLAQCQRRRPVALRRRPGPTTEPCHQARRACAPYLPLLACVRARPPRRTGLRVPRGRAVRPGPRTAVRSREAPPRPLRARRRRPRRLRPCGSQPSGRRHESRHAERGRGSRRLRLGGRRAAPPTVRRHGDLRDARRGLHPPSELGRHDREGAARMPA